MVFLDSVSNIDEGVNMSTPASYELYYDVYYSRGTSTIWLIEEGKKFLKHFHTITNFPTDTAIAHCASAGHLVSLAVSSRRLAQPGDRAVMFNELDPLFVHVN